MLQVYPFASGSFYTASFALSVKYAISASSINYTDTASRADSGQGVSGSAAAINICLISYTDYQTLISNASLKEQCFYPTS